MPHSPLLLPPRHALTLSQPLLLPVLLQTLLQQRGAGVSPLLLRGLLLLQRGLLGMLYCLLGLLYSLMGCLPPPLMSPMLGGNLLLHGLLLLSGTPGGQAE